jgi:hypothetical protein
MSAGLLGFFVTALANLFGPLTPALWLVALVGVILAVARAVVQG